MKARFDHLDGLRGLAAVNVIVNHGLVAFDLALYTGQASDGHGGWDVAVSAWPLLLPLAGANFAVCVFLVLSGFVLAHAYSGTRLGAVALTAKRATRLGVPILVATMLGFGVVAGGLNFNHLVAVEAKSSWLDSALRQTPHFWDALREGLYGALVGPWTPGRSYDSALWTMPVEFAGSLALIVAFTGSRRLPGFCGRVAGGLALLAAAAACYPLYLSLTVIGAAIYLLEPRRRLETILSDPVLMGLLLAISLVLGTVPFSGARGLFWTQFVALIPAATFLAWPPAIPGFVPMGPEAVLHAAGAVLLLVVVEASPACRALLSRALPRFLGRISFPLYLLHMPILLSVGCGGFLLARSAGLSFAAAASVALVIFWVVAPLIAAGAAAVVERPAILLAARVGVLVQRGMEAAVLMIRRLSGRAATPAPASRLRSAPLRSPDRSRPTPQQHQL